MQVLGTVITGIGVIFLLLGSFGILRLPDVYNRLQAGTKCTTFGAFFTIIGVGIMEPAWPGNLNSIGKTYDYRFGFGSFDAYSCNCGIDF